MPPACLSCHQLGVLCQAIEGMLRYVLPTRSEQAKVLNSTLFSESSSQEARRKLSKGHGRRSAVCVLTVGTSLWSARTLRVTEASLSVLQSLACCMPTL